MRPHQIVWFERIVVLSFILGLTNVGLYWRQIAGRLGTWPHLGLFWIAQAAYFAIYALLVWLIARRGNAVGRWLFTIAVVAAAALFFFFALPPPPHWPPTRFFLTAAQCLLSLFSLIFLFGSDIRPWFAGYRAVDPSVFD